MDELAQLGGLRAIKEAMTMLRGYGLRCCLFLQSHAQLKSLDPLDHEAITENCGAIVTFGHTKLAMSPAHCGTSGRCLRRATVWHDLRASRGADRPLSHQQSRPGGPVCRTVTSQRAAPGTRLGRGASDGDEAAAVQGKRR
ncbi:MAG: TraM recognition domain-containing protein [Methylocella sp.]|nr:MAG: hypothetical protein DLM68_16740 [Hyphomicrobiales bacterium]